ncbi:MAG: hypothetical protein ACR2PC_07275 [Tsuneonella suprasediminis]
MILALLLIVPLILFLCWLLFTLAVYALPFFAGVSLGLWMYESGSGAFTALLTGLAAAIATLIFGQMLFALARSPVLRLGVALLFAVPAAFAGYQAIQGIAALAAVPDIWRHVLGAAGALIVGTAAWSRLAAFDLPRAQGAPAPFGR